MAILDAKFRFLTGLLTITLLSACGTSPTYVPPVESRTEPIEKSVPQPTENMAIQKRPSEAAQTRGIEDDAVAVEETIPAPSAPFRSKPAVIALLGSARAAQHNGDLQSAQNALQRAQRIAPQDPNVYFDLADTHYQMHEYSLAEQVALKGVSVAGQDRDLLRKFWLLISEIRYASGNNTGGKQAAQQADRY